MESLTARHALLLIALAYGSTYGWGSALCRLAGWSAGSRAERIGVQCGLGVVVLGWIGFAGLMLRASWLALLGVGLGLLLAFVPLMLRHRLSEERPAAPGATRLLALAVVVALALSWGVRAGQVKLRADGSVAARYGWPDALYRNAILGRVLRFDGRPDWPWLAGEPLRGMSLFRFTAAAALMRSAGVSSAQYQSLSTWLGLFGLPVTCLALFAFFRALRAGPELAALGVLIAAFCGGPRWLLAERFGHSAVLPWAGGDVTALALPALLAVCAVTAKSVEQPARRLGVLTIIGLGSVLCFAPWLGLPVIVGSGLAGLWLWVRERGSWAGGVLAVGAVAGVVGLVAVCGTGPGEGSAWRLLGPAPPIRNLAWAFPFLAEPLRPLLEHPSAVAVAKLLKFALVYLVAIVFFVAGSLWVRLVLLADAREWRWSSLKEPVYAWGAALCAAALLLMTVCDFSKVAYPFAGYDMLRLGAVPLMMANLAVAAVVWRRRERLRRAGYIVLAALFVLYGAWENVQYLQAYRLGAGWRTVPAAEMAAFRHLREQAGSGDVLLIDPAYRSADGDIVGHDWGYASAFSPVPVFVDNEAMARKFGQGAEWDRRAQQAQALFRGRLAWTGLATLGPRQTWWVLVQEGGAVAPPDSLCKIVFEQDGVRLYRCEPGGP